MRRVVALAAESWRVSRAARGPSVVVAVTVAAACVLVLLTAGRAAAAEQQVLSSIDQAGSRVIVMAAAGPDSGPESSAVERVAALDRVTSAIGVGPALDVRNAWVVGGASVASRSLHGGPSPELSLVSGRWPGRGEAVVSASSARSLGLTRTAGGVVSVDGSASWAVVGVFAASGALADLDRLVLTGPGPHDDLLGRLYVVVSDPAAVAPVGAWLGELAGIADPAGVTVTTPQALADLAAVVGGQLGAVARQQAAVALAASLAFVAVVLYAVIGSRRRDVGRRRALGASRSDVAVLVLGQAAWPSIVGAVAGAAVGLAAVRLTDGALPALPFSVAVAVLAFGVGVVAAVPAAVVAAVRDPVRVLRVP